MLGILYVCREPYVTLILLDGSRICTYFRAQKFTMVFGIILLSVKVANE